MFLKLETWAGLIMVVTDIYFWLQGKKWKYMEEATKKRLLWSIRSQMHASTVEWLFVHVVRTYFKFGGVGVHTGNGFQMLLFFLFIQHKSKSKSSVRNQTKKSCKDSYWKTARQYNEIGQEASTVWICTCELSSMLSIIIPPCTSWHPPRVCGCESGSVCFHIFFGGKKVPLLLSATWCGGRNRTSYYSRVVLEHMQVVNCETTHARQRSLKMPTENLYQCVCFIETKIQTTTDKNSN